MPCMYPRTQAMLCRSTATAILRWVAASFLRCKVIRLCSSLPPTPPLIPLPSRKRYPRLTPSLLLPFQPDDKSRVAPVDRVCDARGQESSASAGATAFGTLPIGEWSGTVGPLSTAAPAPPSMLRHHLGPKGDPLVSGPPSLSRWGLISPPIPPANYNSCARSGPSVLGPKR